MPLMSPQLHWKTLANSPKKGTHMKYGCSILVIAGLIFGSGCQKNMKNQTNTPPAWAKSASIYEVNLRQYSESGSFADFAEHLPRLKKLGVDILWFMPIYPIGVENSKGTLGSYYSIRDYTAVNPEHGSLEDFRKLVREIHSMGMYVILDWVANHTAWDHTWAKDHPDWYLLDSLGHFQPPVPDWTDVIDLNYENPDMRQAMIDAMAFWVKEADVDGFRCDVAEMVPLDFWEEARNQLDPMKSLFWLAEGSVPELHSRAFHMTYDWDLFHLMNRVAKGERAPCAIDSLMRSDLNRYPKSAYRMRFSTNHDENSWNGTVFERLGQGAQAFAVLTATLPGMPLVYSGQEAGLDKRLNFFEKDPIDWDDVPLQSFYEKLLHLKTHCSCMANGDDQGRYHAIKTKSKSVFGFVLEDSASQIFVVTNLNHLPVPVSLNDSTLTGQYRSLFGDESITVRSPFESELSGWGYEVYVREP